MIVTLDGGEEMFDLKRQFIERLVYATSLLGALHLKVSQSK